jgi:DNA repair protein RadD
MTFINSLQLQREVGASSLAVAGAAHLALEHDTAAARFADSLFASVSSTTVIRATLTSAQTIQLRPYQRELLERLQAAIHAGARAPLVVAPTGSGKTVLFCELLIVTIAEGERALVAVPTRALLTQTVAAITALGITPDVIAPGFPQPTGRPVTVGTVQSLARRLDRLPPFDLVLVDEAHHVVAGQWRALIAAQPQAVTIGFTATPERRDGKGIGAIAGGVFDTMLVGATVKELTEQGFLAKTRCFADRPPPSGP